MARARTARARRPALLLVLAPLVLGAVLLAGRRQGGEMRRAILAAGARLSPSTTSPCPRWAFATA
jgi:hypothetical protein